MQLRLSKFGEKLGSKTGILELMDDLGRAMAGTGMRYMLGGGNPAGIPAVQAVWRRTMQSLLDAGQSFDALLGNYDVPQGRPRFLEALVKFLNQKFGWGLTTENVAVTAGSQGAFFALFNMLAGEMPDGSCREVLLPLMPEYIGYADQGVCPQTFRSFRPAIEFRGPHRFKYHVDFDALTLSPNTAALAISRPTNPTGNVLSDTEMERLGALAKQAGVPLFVDNAYGAPFPKILFKETTPVWNENIVYSMSLSKLGLPGARTGIVVANKELIRILTALNAVLNLANNNIGQELVAPLLESGEIEELCDRGIQPFYLERRNQALAWVEEYFDDSLPYYLHECEGSPFLWLWCKDFPISSREFYERLKARGVLVVPGHYFFFGLDEPWRHADECIRLNYSQPPEVVREGLRLLGEEVARGYGSVA